ncbi:MAG: SCP2 sterol-binding domain-containing protein [Candidatus Lokiarchaeota archaeon]|nr:SCP2 sterol-binding domain-containing protein [Candidatus Lokiarchaeota archaeon]
MLNSKSFSSVLHDLENHDGEFIAVLDKIIKFAVTKFKSTEELREEIAEYDDIFQIIITDINFNFWLSVSNSSMIYKKGINRSASFRIIYTKDIFVKILKREMYGTDAFMKGLIKADGDLSQGLRFIKLFRLFMKYLNNGFEKEDI